MQQSRGIRGITIGAITVVAALALVAAKPGGGGGGDTSTTTFPASGEFRCPDGLIQPDSDCSADRIQGDSLGTYSGSYVLLSSTYRFRMEESERTVFVDFSERHPDEPVIPCSGTRFGCYLNFTTAHVGIHPNALVVNPTDWADNPLTNGLLDIPIGESRPARVKINFEDPSGRSLFWTIRFNPAYTNSTSLIVTRLDENTWEAEATSSHRARLLATGSGKLKSTDEGLYIMPFKLRMVRL